MNAWIIVHKPTGNWFPQRFVKGQTHIDIHDKPFKECLPRLWPTEGKARGWLKSYCKGPIITNTDTEQEDSWSPSYTVIRGTIHRTEESRPIEDYAIIAVRITNV